MNLKQRRQQHKERVNKRNRVEEATGMVVAALYLILNGDACERPHDPVIDALFYCGINVLKKLSPELDDNKMSEQTLNEARAILDETDRIVSENVEKYGYTEEAIARGYR